MCRVLGCTFDELGRRMSATEYLMWRADYLIEPWGDKRADYQAASIVQSNLMPWTKESIELEDCILSFKERVEQKWQDMKSMMFARGRALQKKAKRNKVKRKKR